MIDNYRIASPGKFVVVTADGMSSFTWVEGEFNTDDEALDHVIERCKTGYFYATWIHDDKGECLLRAQP